MVRLAEVCRTALVLVLLTCSCAVGQVASDRDATATEEQNKLLKQAKEAKVTLDFDNASLDYIVQYLSEQTHLLFVIAPSVDAKALRLTAHLKDVSLATALNCLLGFKGLAFWPEGDMIFISSALSAQKKKLEMRAYDVSDLLLSPPDHVYCRTLGGYGDPWRVRSSNEILELVQAAAYQDVADTERRIELKDSTVLVKADSEAHERIAQLLDDLRSDAQLRIRTTGHLFRLSASDAAALASERGNIMGADKAGKLFRKASEAGKVLRSFVVDCVNGQQNGADCIVAHEYVRDYNVQVAANAVVYDPVIGQVRDRYLFEFLPQANTQAQTVQLTMAAEVSKVEMPFTSVSTNNGDIQLATMAAKRFATTVFLKGEEFALFELGAGDEKTDVTCLLVGVATAKEERKAARRDEEVIKQRTQAREAALDKLSTTQIAVNFHNAALTEVFDYLGKNTPFNFFVENDLLQYMRDNSLRFSMIAQSMPVRNVLDTIASFHPVHYEPMDEVVVILSPGRVFEQIIVRRYSLADFVGAAPDLLAGINYDIGRVPSKPQSEIGEGVASAAAFVEETPSPVRLSAKGLQYMIRNEIDPESWDRSYAAMMLDRGRGLTIRHLPHVHAEVQKLIDKFRQATQRMVNVDVRVVEVSKATVQELFARPGKEMGILDDKTRDRLLRDAEGARGWNGFNFTCMDSQWVYCCDVREKDVLSDYDVIVSTAAPAYDPVVTWCMTTGLGVEFTGIIAPNEKDLQIECRTVVGIEAGPLRTAETGGGPVQLAQIQRLVNSTATTVPDGKTVAVLTTAASPTLTDGVFLILIRPTIVRR